MWRPVAEYYLAVLAYEALIPVMRFTIARKSGTTKGPIPSLFKNIKLDVTKMDAILAWIVKP